MNVVCCVTCVKLTQLLLLLLLLLLFVIILWVYILHTLYSVTPCSIINTERTAVQHSVCVPGIFSVSLTSSTYRCRCSWLLLHLATVSDTQTHKRA